MSVFRALRRRRAWSRCVLGCAVVLCGGCQKNEQAPISAVSRAPAPAPAPRSPEEQAEDDAFQAGAGRPATARTLFSTARLLRDQGRTADCETVLIRTITQYPDYLPAYCELAELRLNQRRVDDAMAALSTGIKLAPKNAVLLNDMGMCYMLRGEYKLALQYFTDAAALVSQNARYRSNMAACLGLLGRYEEAYSLYKQILPAEQAQHNLGVLMRARKETRGNLPGVTLAPAPLAITTQPAQATPAAIAGTSQTQPAITLVPQSQPAGGLTVALVSATRPASASVNVPFVHPPAQTIASTTRPAHEELAKVSSDAAAPDDQPEPSIIHTVAMAEAPQPAPVAAPAGEAAPSDSKAENDREDLSDGWAAAVAFAAPEAEEAASDAEAVATSSTDAIEDDREDLSDGFAAQMPFAFPEPEETTPDDRAEELAFVTTLGDDQADDDREDLSDGLAAKMAFASPEPTEAEPESAVSERADTQPIPADAVTDATASKDAPAPNTTPQLVEEQEAFLAMQAASEDAWADESAVTTQPSAENTPVIGMVDSDSGEGPPAPPWIPANQDPAASPEILSAQEVFEGLLAELGSEESAENAATQPADEPTESDTADVEMNSPATAPADEPSSDSSMTQMADGAALPVN